MNDSGNDSDYVVEQYIKPTTCSVPLVNDESADLLGNFDNSKRKKIEAGGFNNSDDKPFEDQIDSEHNDDSEEEVESDESDVEVQSEATKSTVENVKMKKSSKIKAPYDGKISQDQVSSLLKGSSKSNRFVLYVTNLNFGTSKEHLNQYFSTAGTVKGIRIPKKRKGGFAFVEMDDIEGFKNAFTLHNTILDERPIKIQLSEAGKKKSANKKNILKQKNRKLAEMRNETKSFSKSGKNYDKSIKKEIAKEKLQQTKMWERRKARRDKRKKKI